MSFRQNTIAARKSHAALGLEPGRQRRQRAFLEVGVYLLDDDVMAVVRLTDDRVAVARPESTPTWRLLGRNRL